MFLIEMSPGQDVQLGPCTLRVLAVHPDEVVFALLDPTQDCVCCGARPATRLRCPVCRAEALVCAACVPSRSCPRCASPWEAG
jgi:hypothetical protein